MKHTRILSDTWTISKEGWIYHAYKHIKMPNYLDQIFIITLRVESLKDLHRLMKKIDHEKALDSLILAYGLGKKVHGMTIQNTGSVIIEKADHLEKFTIQEMYYKRTKKEKILSMVYEDLLSSTVAETQNQDYLFTLSIETLEEMPHKILFLKPSIQLNWFQTLSSDLTKFAKMKMLGLSQIFQIIGTKTPRIYDEESSSSYVKTPLHTGLAILPEPFSVQGEKPPSLKLHWLHWVLPAWITDRVIGTFIPSYLYARKDREEIKKREKALKSNHHREIRKTLWEKREDFEITFYQEHPNLSYKHLTITTIDGIQIDTFVLFNQIQADLPANQQRWILFLHPADVAYETELPFLAKIAEDTGANIYTGNYRGVGSSLGKPFRSYDLVLDGEAMLQHIITSGVSENHILIHGFSIGGGVATELAASHPGMHLCNDRSFTKLTEAMHELLPTGINKFTAAQLADLNWELDSLSHLENVTGHVLVIASEIESTILGKAKLAHWISNCTGLFVRQVIWLTERYLDEPNLSKRSIRAHCDPITLSSKYTEYLVFVHEALSMHEMEKIHEAI